MKSFFKMYLCLVPSAFLPFCLTHSILHWSEYLSVLVRGQFHNWNTQIADGTSTTVLLPQLDYSFNLILNCYSSFRPNPPRPSLARLGEKTGDLSGLFDLGCRLLNSSDMSAYIIDKNGTHFRWISLTS